MDGCRPLPACLPGSLARMRFVIFGAGAIGGVVGARLHQSGYDVALIARGAHHDAIAAGGLILETPVDTTVHRIPVAKNPAALGITDDDVVLLAVKSQDTKGALEDLRDAAPHGVPVVLLQNGVENERTALRILPEVYGGVVLSPTAHLEPGIVQAFGTGTTGKIDVGRFPHGVDDTVTAVTGALSASRFQSLPNPDIMSAKYAKLIDNLANAAQAVCGVGAPGLDELIDVAREEGRAVLDAAQINYLPANPENQPQRFLWEGIGEIPGRPPAGGSTWQSLTRGTTLETDYLTGEIVFQARLAGSRAPLNELFLELINQTVRERLAPGWITPREIRRRAAV
jgi:2-dehydropantoate 2-reductase